MLRNLNIIRWSLSKIENERMRMRWKWIVLRNSEGGWEIWVFFFWFSQQWNAFFLLFISFPIHWLATLTLGFYIFFYNFLFFLKGKLMLLCCCITPPFDNKEDENLFKKRKNEWKNCSENENEEYERRKKNEKSLEFVREIRGRIISSMIFVCLDF